MIIKELYIENFGKLSKYKKTFSHGLNSFVEDNGFGKTTLTVFIKTMLYGFDETRRQSLDENDRKRYIPWQGGAFGGYLVFEVNGKTYRVERSFQTKGSEDTFTLYDLDTGAISSDFSSSLGDELFGIDADGFERTVFLSEKNLSGKNTNQTISAKLSNLVGTDGDIDGFDSAIKLLDDRRKFYQKKGGAGEIQDVKNEISELEDEIRILSQRRDNAAKTEEEISALAEKIKSIKQKKEGVLEKERKEKLESEKRSYEIQYANMLGALKGDEKREEQLFEFFSKKLPRVSEIAAVSENAEEVKRLNRTLIDMGENNELSSLRTFFKNDTTVEECERMHANAKKVSESKANFYTNQEYSYSSPFAKVPTVKEIDEHTAKLTRNVSSGVKTGSFALAIIGLILITVGLVLGITVSTPLYSIAIVGFLLTIVSIISISKSKSNKETEKDIAKINSFICEVYSAGRDFDSPLSALISMRADLEKMNSDKERISRMQREREASAESTLRTEREVREFIEKFPLSYGLTLEEATADILYKKRRFDMLTEYESEKDTKRSVCKERIKALTESINSFISLFPITSGDPINEIRNNLAEYEVLHSSLTRRRTEAESFAASHGITYIPKISSQSTVSDTSFSNELRFIDEQLIEAEREKSRLELEYNNSIISVQKIEELEEKLLEKNEQIEIYKDNLATITKAKDMLARAKDSMTGKYLEPTKKGFSKYLALIEDEVGEFTMDTAFTITKTDLGKSRQAEAYSRGTRDLHALAIRLSLIDALYESEKPPIILDDPFIAFDDKHTERAISVIRKLSTARQIFYFTCSKSRKAK